MFLHPATASQTKPTKRNIFDFITTFLVKMKIGEERLRIAGWGKK
jgi:hypothetical protein